VTRALLLDTAVLGRLTHPRPSDEIRDWLARLREAGVAVMVPEIADYELRRELLREGLADSLARLDRLGVFLRYVPLTTRAMRLAAEFWARARAIGRPTAPNQTLDGDVILAAQAAVVADEADEAIIATDNVGHLSLFADARRWTDIGPEGT